MTLPISPYANCNFTISLDACTLQTCCLAQSPFLYIPDLGGNLFFTIYFALLLVPQGWLAWRYRTWEYSVAVAVGLVLEVIGYAARVELHVQPFSNNGFLIYLVCLTLAPAFLSAAIYLSISRIVILYGEHHTRITPLAITIIFVLGDSISLILQAIGGGIAESAYDATETSPPGTSPLVLIDSLNAQAQPGVDIMIAGLLMQAVSLLAFIAFWAYFMLRVLFGESDKNPEKTRVRQSALFRAFVAGLIVSTLAILIRSVFRVAELWDGFFGPIWNDEVDFMVLDGAMVALAALLLTVLHPGPGFAGLWHVDVWRWRRRRTANGGEGDEVVRPEDAAVGAVAVQGQPLDESK